MAEDLNQSDQIINSSYLCGYKDPDWGYGHYFTYFSEFHRKSPAFAILEAIILSAIYVTAAVENLFVLVVLVRAWKKSTGNNHCIANLSLTGLTSNLCLPLVIVTRITDTWVFGRVPCGLLLYTVYCGCIMTVWTMTLISIDRYRSTKKRSPLPKRTISILLGLMWIVALLASLPISYYFMTRTFNIDGEVFNICTLVFPNSTPRVSFLFTFPSVILGFLVPLFVIMINYIRVMKTLRSSMARFSSKTATTGFFKGIIFRKQREMKVVRILIMLVVVFCLMWTPISIAILLLMMDGVTDMHIMTSQIFIATLSVALLNGCINPFIYAFVNESCRNGLYSLIKSLSRRKVNAVKPLEPGKI